MAKSNKGPVKKFDFPVQVEVRPAKFTPLAVLRYVDPDKLNRGSHNIEIGYSEGGCCRNSVYAVIKNGMVSAIEVEPCKDKPEIRSKEFRALVAQAFKAVGGGQDKWKPMPVRQFFSSTNILQEIGGRFLCIVIDSGGRLYSCCLIRGNWPFCIPLEDEIIR
jgi:hypothetical protein